MIDLSTGVFSCFGSHLSVFAMHRGAQNANRGKKVEKNTGRVLYDAGLTPGLYIRNFIHRRNYEMNLFKLEIPGFETECPNTLVCRRNWMCMRRALSFAMRLQRRCSFARSARWL